MNRKQWQVVRWLLKEQEWDYFHFVDIGLDRMHHGFWNYFDPKHVQFKPGNPYQNAIPEYYSLLDEQIGTYSICCPPIRSSWSSPTTARSALMAASP